MAINRAKVLSKAQKYVQQGKLQKAVDEYERLVEDDPNDVRTLLKVGDLYSKMGNVEAALDTYKQVADHYSRDGFFLKAVAVYKQMLKLDPSAISIYTKLAELYNQLGLNSEAMKQYQIVAKHYETKGMKKESLDTFKKMAELDPNNLASRVKLAELYSREGHNDQALQDFVKIAAELKERGNSEDLIKVYEKIVKIDQSNTKLVRELAQLYLESSEPKRALAKLQVCFKKDPKNEQTLSLLARAFNDLQQPEKAKAVYLELMTLYNEQGNPEKAEQVRAKLDGEVELDANDSFVSQSSFQLPQPDEALPPTQEGVAGEAPSIDKTLADIEVYLRYGLADKAVQALKVALMKDPSIEAARSKLIDILTSNNDRPTACALLMEIAGVAAGQNNTNLEIAILNQIVSVDVGFAAATSRLQELGVSEPVSSSAPVQAESMSETSMEESMLIEDDGDSVVELAEESIVEDEPLSMEASSADSTVFELPMESHEIVEDDAVELDAGAVVSDAHEIVPPPSAPSIDLDAIEGEMLREPDADEDLAAKSQIEFVADEQVADNELDLEASIAFDIEPSVVAPTAEAEAEIEIGEPVAEEPAFDLSAEAGLELDDSFDLSGGIAIGDVEDSPVDAVLDADALSNPEPAEPVLDIEAATADEAPSLDADALDLLSNPESAPVANEELQEDVQVAAPAASIQVDADSPFASEMEEALFFKEQGLTEEVQAIVEDILRKDPNYGPALELANDMGISVSAAVPVASEEPAVQNFESAAADPEEPVVAQVEDSLDIELESEMVRGDAQANAEPNLFDLGDALKDEIAMFNDGEELEIEQELEYPTFDEVFSAFKKGVKEAVAEHETEAHYDLGIAYKEMGLLEDAIREFSIAMKDPNLLIDCCSMTGLCYSELNRYDESVQLFKKAIDSLAETDDRILGLRYDLAEVYVKQSLLREALETFKQVYKRNKSFRDVSHRMKEVAERLEGAVGDDSVDSDNLQMVEGKKKKNKISYL